MQTLFTRNIQVVHTRLVERLTPDNPLARAPYLAAPFSLSQPMGVGALDGEVTRQSAMVAYVDVFHLMFLTTLAIVPVVLFMRRPKGHAVEIEGLIAD
jgi:DHA2 family multidrug resistance protein